MPTINRTPESLTGVVGIVGRIADHDAAAADRVSDAIDAPLQASADSPLIGRAREELAPNLRSMPVLRYRNYVVSYRPAADGIEVIRVLHGARDLPPNLRAR